MKFSPNISTFFQDLVHLGEKYKYLLSQSKIKFETIECQNPYQLSLNQWTEIFNECKQMTLIERLPKWNLINSEPIFSNFKSIPKFDEYQNQILSQTLIYAKHLNCNKVHLVMSDTLKDSNYDQNFKQIMDLLKKSCQFFQNENITCVIEPLSIRENYYLQSYSLAKSIVLSLNQPNLKILLDTFHLQKLHGNVTHYLNDLKDYIGHVQISQVPNRDSPFNEGELDYKYVLKLLDKVYNGPIGLEYNCKTSDTFEWTDDYL